MAEKDMQEGERDVDSTVPDDSEAKIRELADELFHKTGNYVQAELRVTLDDYKLLEQMNHKTSEKYRDLKQVTDVVSASLLDLDKNYSRLEPYLSQVDELENKVIKLEEISYSIDSYSKRLESKFKALEKSSAASASSSK